MLKRVFNIVAFVVFISISVGHICAQTGCPAVSAGPAVTLPCGINCTTLHASSFPSASTNAYSVDTIPYSLYPFSTGTPVLVHTDDHFSDTITLPFNFCFFGNVYNHILVGANEVLSFNDTNALRYNNYQINTPVPSQGNIPFDIQNSIMAPWQDIDPTLKGNIYYQVVGTAPCRMFIATWDSVPYYGSIDSRDPIYCPIPLYATSQVILYETTNAIDINIMMKGICPQWNGGDAIEGILDPTGTIAYTVPGRNATQWTAQNDAWRFTPSGTAKIYSITWYQGANRLGVGDSIQVCPSASLQTQTTYTAIDTITPCGGGTPIVVSDSVVVSLTGTLLAGIDSSKNVTCTGLKNGKAWAHTSGGALPVSFDWTNAHTQANLGNTLNVAGLDTGTYVFTATNNNSCSRTDTVIITEPGPLGISTLSQTPTSCISNSGSVTVTGTGGTPWYTNGIPTYLYNWSNNVTGPVDTALAKGPVSVTVTDSNACTASQSFTVLQTSTVSTNPVAANPLCHQFADGSINANPIGGTPPYKFSWSNGDSQQEATNLMAGSYSCTISDSYGCSAVADTTLIDPPQLVLGPPQAIAETCQGLANGVILATPTGGTMPYFLSATPDGVNFTADSNGVMAGLAPGNYTVVLADNNGCTETAMINVPAATPDFFDVTIDSALCYGYSDGAAHIVDSSQQNRPYQYSVDSTGQFQSSSNFENLSPGDHIITAVNKNGCKSYVPIVIPQPAAIIAGISPDTVVIALGQSQQVAVNYLNTTGNVSFAWTPSFGLSCMDCPNPVVGPYILQDYTVTVSSVNQGATCYGYASLYVTVLPHQPIFIPNSFTPNGDGINDLFEIYGETIKVVDLKIFNRWGELVFETHNQFTGWDGTYKGQLQPPGVFSYETVITFLDDTQEQKTGSVTLLR